jgi:hypothetical protein
MAVVLASAAVLLLAVLALSGAFAGESEGEVACHDELAPLTPAGSGAEAFTMGIRVDRPADVHALDAALGGRILPRDAFVINTETGGPGQWAATLDAVTEEFSCNRVAVLNGLGTKPGRAHYVGALASRPELEAVLLDWEPDDWAGAGRGRWQSSVAWSRARIQRVASELEDDLRAGDTRLGLVLDYLPGWDYGLIARTLGSINAGIDPSYRGLEIVQTQPNCATPSAPGPLIGPLAAKLRDQYRPLFDKRPTKDGWVSDPGEGDSILQHLGFEIAFSTSPNPRASLAVDRIGPEEAARCTRQVIEDGGAGILYWAEADAVIQMLNTPIGREVRPADGKPEEIRVD